MSFQIEKKFAIETAQEAGNLLMRNYGRMQSLDWHSRTNFKIEVDDLSDKLIRKRIEDTFPEHNIYSEEQEGIDRNSEFSWVIDPLDGTIPYTYGISDHFSVCIALVKEKEPVLGVIYAPKRNEIYVAEKGAGAFCNADAISVSLEDNINHALVGTDPGRESKQYRRQDFAPTYRRLYSSNGIVALLCSGCASVPLALVASGKLHAYLSNRLEPWDMAAAVPIIREAGGKVTNIKGKEWELGDTTILAANSKLHYSLLDFIAKP